MYPSQTNQTFINTSCEHTSSDVTSKLGRIFESLSQFDLFVLGKLQLQHVGNITGRVKEMSAQDYYNFAIQFCEKEIRCNISQIKEKLSRAVSQLMLMNGYVPVSGL